MHDFIYRKLGKTILRDIETFPVVAIIGPRQSGKSTLAKEILKTCNNAIYLDLELPVDLMKFNRIYSSNVFTRVGKDLQEITDFVTLFLDKADEKGIPITIETHAIGVHGFDATNDDVRTREIISDTLRFLSENLK
ncbi:MAG: AAA family ATPase [Spirochaetales bacterium]|nr:AAA family ATPase [Spirochaetales bacterium]